VIFSPENSSDHDTARAKNALDAVLRPSVSASDAREVTALLIAARICPWEMARGSPNRFSSFSRRGARSSSVP
jgi:hypothetical protein